jgi:hypothetical protein
VDKILWERVKISSQTRARGLVERAATMGEESPPAAADSPPREKEDSASFKRAWAGARDAATSCRCAHLCLASHANVSRALVDAIAKAAVFQTAGKPFGDANDLVAKLATDLVAKLMKFADDAENGKSGLAPNLADLAAWINEWVTRKRSFFGEFGAMWSKEKQTEAVERVRQDVARGECWPAADRERVSRELLLRYDRGKVAHCEEAFATEDELFEHKKKCAFRPTQCPNEGCMEVHGANVAAAHDAQCPHKIVKCPNACDSTNVTRRALKMHVDLECPRRPVTCPFAPFGCASHVYAGTLRAHMKEHAHDHVADLAKRVGRMSDAAEKTEAKVAEMAVALADVGPNLGKVGNLSKELFDTTAKATIVEKGLLDLEKLVVSMGKALANLEVQVKQQRKDIGIVMTAVDRVAKETAGNSAAIAKLASPDAAAGSNGKK